MFAGLANLKTNDLPGTGILRALFQYAKENPGDALLQEKTMKNELSAFILWSLDDLSEIFPQPEFQSSTSTPTRDRRQNVFFEIVFLGKKFSLKAAPRNDVQ